jgi:hypothetical protein
VAVDNAKKPSFYERSSAAATTMTIAKAAGPHPPRAHTIVDDVRNHDTWAPALFGENPLGAFRNGKLCAVYATSLLLIGATFAAFPYFVPILTQVTGFSKASSRSCCWSTAWPPSVGNIVVGRQHDGQLLGVVIGSGSVPSA